jgi:putative ABC transport system permease protein
MRVYALPGNQYPLSLEQARSLERHLEEIVVSETGLPLVSSRLYLETKGLTLFSGETGSPYGGAEGEDVLLRRDLYFLVLPGVAAHMDVVEGTAMEEGAEATGDEMAVWLHKSTADQMGISVGELFEIRDQGRNLAVPIRVAGLWRASNPQDSFWFSNPDLALRNKLVVREEDYGRLIEPLFNEQVGFVSWYLVLDERPLVPEQMEDYAEGFTEAFEAIGQFVPDSRVDGSPIDALSRAVERERNLTALLLVFSVPLMGFLLYFLALISTITLRWQRRETAIMVSRGLRPTQLLLVGLIEAAVIVGFGCVLGVLLGVRLAQLMGYTKSFMSFTWRDPLPVSNTAFSAPMLIVTVLATLTARLWPLIRSARTSVVSHERRRARAPEKPFWQRFYLDFALLIPVLYAYSQLAQEGTLVPDAWAAQEATGWLATRAPDFVRDLVELLRGSQDPLLFLVPALFALTCSLLLVRFFPTLMRLGDWIGGLGRKATFYLAFRQLARQSSQYTSALLLVISSLGLGAFMASMAVSLDKWLTDRVHYAVGSDVYIKQLPDPSVEDVADMSPSEGAWVLPITDYLEVPGVTHAARVGRYPVSISQGNSRPIKGTYIGLDRLDAPEVVFYREDFGRSLGNLMNQLAPREDGVLLSELLAAENKYEIGDKLPVRLSLWFGLMSLETDFTVVGTFKYFPTVYEDRDGQPTIIGNLDFVYEQIGAVLIHDIWLRIRPDANKAQMMEAVQEMGVHIHRWVDIRDEMAIEQARVERVGIFGTLTIGFLAAAVLSGIGLMVYNYASLQERLFRFTILRAVGLGLLQIVSQVGIEYVVLMVYGVAGGAAIGVLTSRLFIPFFQATDRSVLNPPMLLPLVAWEEIGRISGIFVGVLIVVQIAVIAAALRRGVFQALRMGDRE